MAHNYTHKDILNCQRGEPSEDQDRRDAKQRMKRNSWTKIVSNLCSRSFWKFIIPCECVCVCACLRPRSDVGAFIIPFENYECPAFSSWQKRSIFSISTSKTLPERTERHTKYRCELHCVFFFALAITMLVFLFFFAFLFFLCLCIYTCSGPPSDPGTRNTHKSISRVQTKRFDLNSLTKLNIAARLLINHIYTYSFCSSMRSDAMRK